MIARVRAGIKVLFGLHNPGRNVNIFPDDTFLASYPKSGNTWARFLIANLLHPGAAVSFANIDGLVPDVESTQRRTFNRVARPRVIKSHYVYSPEYPRTIYIVRDPRDVALSQYHFQRKRQVIADDFPLDAYVSRFIAGEVCSYGSWGSNVGSWFYTQKDNPKFLLLRYEDMIAYTERALSKIAGFLGLPFDQERITHAVESSSADNMRKLEKAESDLSGLTRTRKDLPFVRTAKSGGWRNELPTELVAKIESAWSPLMRSLGYEPMTESNPLAHGVLPPKNVLTLD